MKKRILIGIGFYCLAGLSALGQAIPGNLPEFSQPYLSPALVGFSDHAAVQLFQRSEQFAADIGFSTTMVSGQFPMFYDHGNQRIGTVNMSFIRDASQLGVAPYRQSVLQMGYAYGLQLSPYHEVSVSVGGGYYLRRLGLESLNTASQWVQFQGLDETLPTGEESINLQADFASLNAGIAYQWTDAQGIPRVQFALSGFHLNQPNEAYIPTGISTRPIRWTGAAMARVAQIGSITLIPMVYGGFQPFRYQVNAGLGFELPFTNDNPFDPLQDGLLRFSTRYTLAQSVVFGLQFDQPNFQVALAYDTNVGRNNPYQSAFEFGITIRQNRRKQVSRTPVEGYAVEQVARFYAEENPDSPVEMEANEQEEAVDSIRKESYAFTIEELFNFEVNEYELDPIAKRKIQVYAALLESDASLQVRIVGHTDDTGKRRANMVLAKQRADAVKDHLISLGIAPARITVESRGSDDPKYANDSEVNRARNRRVEFVISARG